MHIRISTYLSTYLLTYLHITGGAALVDLGGEARTLSFQLPILSPYNLQVTFR